MKERFEGSSKARLIEALKRQEFVGGNGDVAEALASRGSLVEYRSGETLITQGGEDNDIVFLIAGSVAIVINGNNVATRFAGETVGEMSATEPSQKRSANVVALETIVALRIEGSEFHAIGDQYPLAWKAVAQVLSRRLLQRNVLIPVPNEAPRLFIISSGEALQVANELQSMLDRDVMANVWTKGVFFAGDFTLEALETMIAQSDFAVAVAQPDDIVESRGATSRGMRDNVLFELGLFMGHLTRHRTILVHPRVPDLKLPSDLQGLTAISYAEPATATELPIRLGPVCTEIRKIVSRLGVRKTHT
ncbi:nucleotide-binding protein [Roseiarcaceae bacterium H3SJ34-1]|uniref:TIR domain-containing protein n=1 Tax=Terripilifer ovatus TaxID=3032367 RepID=UPI003AB92971|nr:nucleotide-binding protein [Roseiarcaceae bacterium H3SJ34-1]